MKRLLLVVLCLLVVGSVFFLERNRNVFHQNEILLAESDGDDGDNEGGIRWWTTKPGRA